MNAAFTRLLGRIRMSHDHQWELDKEIQMSKERHNVTELCRSLIDHSTATFQRAVDKGANVTGWTPERVLANNAAFPDLCKKLKDQATWDRLTAGEQKFIVRALAYKKVTG